MPTQLLPRPRDDARPRISLAEDISLATTRAHEVCGPARRTFAMWVAGRTSGPVIWIVPAWERNRLHPDGMYPYADPTRFLTVAPRRTEDLLWSVEECLRSGAAPLVIADLPGAPALTPVRRLHLAAENGAEAATAAGTPVPTGLLLTPGDGGAQGVETRWHMAPTHEGRTRRWRLTRSRARTQPVKSWAMSWDSRGLTTAPAGTPT